MIDGHVHLEKGEYCEEWVNQFVDYALSRGIKENNMYIEQSSGLTINYGDTELGMNKEMLNYMLKHKVRILTASDAHVPQNVGLLISEMANQIKA